MIKSLGILIKDFLLIELAISSVVLVTFIFLRVNVPFRRCFSLDNLWLGLRGATFGAIPASLIMCFFYYVVPALKNN
jgi:hypothetical protein